ncbi:uncharacterized protein KY384_003135 [Bacidia gigantensis]|uniref:uncharacterized protein n=1 Tax=Bacidia gigantensis TaxID=2732470 RepID=UPI001D0487AE|nr:uncharacterized protein KY384_003135 [Bacidia gigantensis]KAG8531506.1 hypothetical protein KY384_003135 [Bacidia gigantensis]
MTTAHRPTFDPARGKEALRGPAYHQRLQPAHTHLKTRYRSSAYLKFAGANLCRRQAGQGGDADPVGYDLKAQLLNAEAAHFDRNPSTIPGDRRNPAKRQLEDGPERNIEDAEDLEAKKRKVLEETRTIDAASESDSDSSDEDSEDEEDETAELLRELEKIKKERAEKKEREERAQAADEQEQRESDIAYGNPLLNPNRDAESKRRWDDDVVFRNQARGTEKKGKPEFVNDLLRSDFHKRFMVGWLVSHDRDGSQIGTLNSKSACLGNGRKSNWGDPEAMVAF